MKKRLIRRPSLCGDKKFAWEIYEALETPAEVEAARFAETVIGQAN